jgi:hypothetical protein
MAAPNITSIVPSFVQGGYTSLLLGLDQEASAARKNNQMIQYLMKKSFNLLLVIVIVMRIYCFWLLDLNYYGPCNELILLLVTGN